MSANSPPKKRLVVFGGVAVKGPIAIGVNAVGVVAIGINAGGTFLAIGVNAAAPIAIGLVNAIGIVGVSLVNAFAAWGIGMVNATGHPYAALGFAGLYFVVTLCLRVTKGRSAPAPFAPIDEAPATWTPLSELRLDEDGSDRWTRCGAMVTSSGLALRTEGGGETRTMEVPIGPDVGLRLPEIDLERPVFVRLVARARPTADMSGYRAAASTVEWEAVEIRRVRAPGIAKHLGLVPWTVWNTHVAGSALLVASLVAYVLARYR